MHTLVHGAIHKGGARVCTLVGALVGALGWAFGCIFFGALVWPQAGQAQSVPGPAPFPPALRCEVSYAGAVRTVEVTSTDDPYAVPAIDMGGRFGFRPVWVRGPHLQERIDVYVTLLGEAKAIPVQHALWLPPWPQPARGRSVPLSGEQHLYAGPLERELIYTCQWHAPEPRD